MAAETIYHESNPPHLMLKELLKVAHYCSYDEKFHLTIKALLDAADSGNKWKVPLNDQLGTGRVLQIQHPHRHADNELRAATQPFLRDAETKLVSFYRSVIRASVHPLSFSYALSR